MYLFRPHIKIEGLTVYIFEFLSVLLEVQGTQQAPPSRLSD